MAIDIDTKYFFLKLLTYFLTQETIHLILNPLNKELKLEDMGHFLKKLNL